MELVIARFSAILTAIFHQTIIHFVMPATRDTLSSMGYAFLFGLQRNALVTPVDVRGTILIIVATAYNYQTVYNQEMEFIAIYVQIGFTPAKVFALILPRLMTSTATY